MKIWSLALLAAAATLPVSAQVAGSLTGSVTDPSGAAVPGATITLSLPGGDRSLYSTTTSAEGIYTLLTVTAGNYDLTVEAKGFKKSVLQALKIDPGHETTAPPVKLDVGEVSSTVEVKEAPTTVDTVSVEVGSTISKSQIENLPIMDRSPLGFLHTQVGVSAGRTGLTTVDGQRTSYVNVTLDGINIQDNFIRTNDADFLPNLLLLDQVSEVRVTNSNSNALNGGGSSQVSFVTPHGTNQYHGSAYWSNRNSDYAANSWFNNQSGVQRAFLNQNQAGFTFGGPIFKNKLFFYTNYEAYRQHQQTSEDPTVLTADARAGIYTYTDTSGVVHKVNVLSAAGVTPDPSVAKLIALTPAPGAINNFRVGDSSAALLRNTAGYAYNERDNRTRDNVTARLDYNPSDKHSFTLSALYNRDILDRPDEDATFDLVPDVTNDDVTRLLSTSWRWSPKPTLTNEVRFGFNLAPALFPRASSDLPPYLLSGLDFTNPQNNFLAQGRFTNTYNMADNGSYSRGPHTFQFGYQMQVAHIRQFNYAGIVPTYGLGIGTTHTGLTNAQLPGIGSTDLTGANNLLATLAGYLSTDTQLFNVSSRTSGYVPNYGNIRNDILDQYSFYGVDTFRAARRLTLTLGLRWEYYTPVDEKDGLALLPVLQNGNVIQTMLSNSTLNFAGSAVGRPWYKSDKNNFAPNLGLAWDIFGDGRTSFRAGYSISYVDDNIVRAADNSQATNAGLSTTVSNNGLAGTVSGGLPAISVPTFQVPITFSSIYAVNSSAAFAMPDPNLVTPYVQQWNVGVQHAFKGGDGAMNAIKDVVLDVRYVGNHATKQIRGFDYNQVQIGALLPDFIKAEANGFLALAKTGVYDPSYNATIPGSQPLPFISTLPNGGTLTNSTVRSDIQTGQVGELASFYQINHLNGTTSFFRNPYALGANVLTNYGNATFNAMQVDITRRFAKGLQFQFNYQFAKALSDTVGSGQTDFEPFLDMNNAKLEKAPPPDYDIRHTFKANAFYDLPFGPGHRLNSNFRPVSKLLEGWNIAGIFTKQSGSPFSILSARGTLNRAARSAIETVDTSLNGPQLDQLLQVRMTGNGPYFVGASAIGADGRAVAPDGTAPFAGQVFFEPGPGTVGQLQRDSFFGPWVWDMDFHAAKVTKIAEGKTLEFRAEATNVFNHPTWSIGDQTVTSTTFGKITSTFYGRRLVQFAMYFRF